MKNGGKMKKTNHLFDLKAVLCYKAVVFLALLLLSYGLFANDLNLRYLPHQAAKVGDGKYQLMKDFDTSVKQVRALYVGDRYIKDDLLFRVRFYLGNYVIKTKCPMGLFYAGDFFQS